MKSHGTQYWIPPDVGTTNSGCFSGLSGGWRSSSGGFQPVGYEGFCWSFNEGHMISTCGLVHSADMVQFGDFSLRMKAVLVVA